MALISCPECNQSVSDTARKCPSCGYVLKKVNYKKLLSVLMIIAVVIAALAAAYYFLIYTPQHLPERAAELLAAGDYVGADKLYARMPKTPENTLIREQLYYESRIVAAAKAQQKTLLFPDSMLISEIVVFEDISYDKDKSTDTERVYNYTEPCILLHYLAKSKGGSMVDGYVSINWEDDINMYEAGNSVPDLVSSYSTPWYITDPQEMRDYADEQIYKASIVMQLQTDKRIGVYDLNRCNSVLTSSFGREVTIIPSGDLVVSPTPYTVTVTPKP